MKIKSKASACSRRWQGLPDVEGLRPSIYIGRCTPAQRGEIVGHLRSLQNSKRIGVQMTAAAVAWLATIGDELHAKIAAEKLCEPRVRSEAGGETIAAYVADYIDRRPDLGERALLNLRQAERKLIE